MRSLLSNGQDIGLLLFDEPSAALDPTAEHGMDNRRLLTTFILSHGFLTRSLRAAEELERTEDHDFLFSQVWSTHTACGPNSVRSRPLLQEFTYTTSQIHE
jgi:hypothetical protein